jgi:hypothetical protein
MQVAPVKMRQKHVNIGARAVNGWFLPYAIDCVKPGSTIHTILSIHFTSVAMKQIPYKARAHQQGM